MRLVLLILLILTSENQASAQYITFFGQCQNADNIYYLSEEGKIDSSFSINSRPYRFTMVDENTALMSTCTALTIPRLVDLRPPHNTIKTVDMECGGSCIFDPLRISKDKIVLSLDTMREAFLMLDTRTYDTYYEASASIPGLGPWYKDGLQIYDPILILEDTYYGLIRRNHKRNLIAVQGQDTVFHEIEDRIYPSMTLVYPACDSVELEIVKEVDLRLRLISLVSLNPSTLQVIKERPIDLTLNLYNPRIFSFDDIRRSPETCWISVEVEEESCDTLSHAGSDRHLLHLDDLDIASNGGRIQSASVELVEGQAGQEEYLTYTGNSDGLRVIDSDNGILLRLDSLTDYTLLAKSLSKIEYRNDALRPKSGNRTIRYTVSLTSGQADTFYRCIYLPPTRLSLSDRLAELPNAFSPNGDDRNDYFDPCLSFPDAYFCRYEIVDSWNNTVYHSVAGGQPWDGTLGGTPADPGLYYYRLILAMSQGMIERHHGDLLLLR